ncbi:MAG: LysR family transcriptional regulator [Deltaproteobacteria bacterium]|nr:LysR family transcriptional regulator [Deltaproteobacteria bacterium]
MLNYIPDLNRLKVFHCVYEAQSLTRAATTLYVTKSAISQSIKSLEDELKEPLFIRNRKSIIPTPFADKLYQIIMPFLRQLVLVVQGSQQVKMEIFGTIRIGAPPLFTKKFLLPILANFRALHPRVHFSLTHDEVRKQIDLIIQGKLDFALVDSFDIYLSKKTPVITSKIFEESEVMACSRRYFQKYFKKNPNFQTLSQADFIAYVEDAMDIKAWFLSSFQKVPSRIDPIFILETADLILSAIRNHMGLGIVPFYLIKDEIKRGDIVVLRQQIKPLNNILSIVFLKQKAFSLAEKTFRDFFLREVKKVQALI